MNEHKLDQFIKGLASDLQPVSQARWTSLWRRFVLVLTGLLLLLAPLIRLSGHAGTLETVSLVAIGSLFSAALWAGAAALRLAQPGEAQGAMRSAAPPV